MNKRAELAIGDIIIAVLVFSFLLVGGFTIYSGMFVANGVTTNSTLNASIQEFAQNSNVLYEDTVDGATQPSGDTLGTDNVLLRGIAAVGNVFNSWSLASQSVTVLSESEGGSMLPSNFWGTITAILIVIITFTVIGAFWRYRMQNK